MSAPNVGTRDEWMEAAVIVGKERRSRARVDGEALAVHLAEHGARVEVVVDLDVSLEVIGAQDASDVLHDALLSELGSECVEVVGPLREHQHVAASRTAAVMVSGDLAGTGLILSGRMNVASTGAEYQASISRP